MVSIGMTLVPNYGSILVESFMQKIVKVSLTTRNLHQVI